MFRLIVLLLFAGLSTNTFAENQDTTHWKLKEDQGGIKVYVGEVSSSSVKAFKSEAILQASIPSILAVMSDSSACREWVYQCGDARKLEGNFARSIRYGWNDFPWPASDRDYVIQVDKKFDPESGRLNMQIKAVDGFVPEDDYVRIHDMDISYTMEPLDGGKATKIIWTQHTDPAGMLPSWLINMLLVSIPHNSLKALEKTANGEKYRDARLDLNAKREVALVMP